MSRANNHGLGFLGRALFPAMVAKLQRDLNERNALEKLSKALACCWAGRKLGFSFLLLKSCSSSQTSINSTNIYGAQILAKPCAKALRLQMCKVRGPVLSSLIVQRGDSQVQPVWQSCNTAWMWCGQLCGGGSLLKRRLEGEFPGQRSWRMGS